MKIARISIKRIISMALIAAAFASTSVYAKSNTKSSVQGAKDFSKRIKDVKNGKSLKEASKEYKEDLKKAEEEEKKQKAAAKKAKQEKKAAKKSKK